MPESDSFGPPFLDQSAKPLPWTKGGPNEDSKPLEPSTSHVNSSVADPIFTIKNRVVTMKDLEALKKSLPPGIDIRITSKNIVKFRARFRKTGHKEVFKTTSDLKSAKQWLMEQDRNAFLDELHPNIIKNNKKTFSDAIKRYKEEELPKKGADARNREYHLDWFDGQLGKMKFSSIRSSDIKEALLALEKEKAKEGIKLAPATIVRYLASLSHLFTISWKEWEWISENPVKKISKPSVSNARQRYLSQAELSRLLKETKNSKCPILLTTTVLALSTGMRDGEIMGLKIGDIQRDQQLIILRSSKNGEPRFIPLKGYAYNLLIEHLLDRIDPNAFLFPSPDDPQRPYDTRSAWRAALQRAGIKNFRRHDLRHTTASYHRMNGIGLHDIGALLGHKDARSTARYAHISTEYKSKMVEKLDQELFGESYEK